MKFRSFWIKTKKFSLYYSPTVALFLFHPHLNVLEELSMLTAIWFYSHNCTKWAHNYTKWIFAKVINILVPKSIKCFHYLFFWPLSTIGKYWPLALSLNTHPFASVIPFSSDFLPICWVTCFQCPNCPYQSHVPVMDSFIYSPYRVQYYPLVI